MKSTLTIEEIMGPRGRLSKSLEGFEFRSSQMQMAGSILEAINSKNQIIIEGGTGTGKTFGYLIPIILSKKKTVISTATKNLQEQIFYKDLPLLQKSIPFKINAMLMKGRKNYLCLFRFHHYFSQISLFNNKNELKASLEQWIKATRFGDLSEIPWLKDDNELWGILSASSDQCLGPDCLFIEDCFINKLRQTAAKERIIIVNHHLFFADMKIKKGGFGEIIPRFQVVLFDEAHAIEDIATSYLGESLSTNQLIELINDLEKKTELLSENIQKDIKKALNLIKAGIKIIIDHINNKNERGKLSKDLLALIRQGPIRIIRNGLQDIYKNEGGIIRQDYELESLILRTRDLDQSMAVLFEERNSNWLNWYERLNRGLVIHVSPLDLSDKLNEFLYKKVESVIFTSATISTKGNFEYFSTRLGLGPDIKGIILSSSFNYTDQALLYIPKDLVVPGNPKFADQIASRIKEILKQTSGRALILFTSYYNLNKVYNFLKDCLLPYTLFKQGDAPRTILLEKFRKDVPSVLLATASFWQGVDLPGETLSCLIIDKLPFASPSEPLVEARIEMISEKGGNPFMEYQVPEAIISLKQGLGRLIRKNTDRGVLSILDKRILNNTYGIKFLESLPDVTVTDNLSALEVFFENNKSNNEGCF